MKKRPCHIVSKLEWDTHFDDREKAFELQQRLSRWSRFDMQKELNRIFNKVCPPGQVWNIPSLELDLGPIDLHDLEPEMAKKLRNLLYEKLHGLAVMAEYNLTGDIQIIEESRSHLDMLASFFLDGVMPWNYRPERGTVNQLMSWQLQHHLKEVVFMVRETGRKKENVRKRMAWQLSESNITAIIKGLEPFHHEEVIDFSTELNRLQEKKTIVQANSADFRKQLWFWVLTHLITGRGTRFNKIAFVKSTIMQMAAHYNISYDKIILYIRQVVEELSNYYSLKTDFLLAIKALSAEHAAKTATYNEPPASDHWLLLPAFLQDPGNAQRLYPDMDFSSMICHLAAQHPSRLRELISRIVINESSWQRLSKVLHDEALTGLWDAIKPLQSDGQEVARVTFTAFLDSLFMHLSNAEKEEFLALKKIMALRIQLYPEAALETLSAYPAREKLRTLLPYIMSEDDAFRLLKQKGDNISALFYGLKKLLPSLKKVNAGNATATWIEDHLALLFLKVVIFYPRAIPSRMLEFLLREIHLAVPAIQSRDIKVIVNKILTEQGLHDFGVSPAEQSRIRKKISLLDHYQTELLRNIVEKKIPPAAIRKLWSTWFDKLIDNPDKSILRIMGGVDKLEFSGSSVITMQDTYSPVSVGPHSENTGLFEEKIKAFEKEGVLDLVIAELLSGEYVLLSGDDFTGQAAARILNGIVAAHPEAFFLALKKKIVPEPQLQWMSASIHIPNLIKAINAVVTTNEAQTLLLEKLYSLLKKLNIRGISTTEMQYILFRKILKAWTSGSWKSVTADQVWRELAWEAWVRRGVSNREFILGFDKIALSLPPALLASFQRFKSKQGVVEEKQRMRPLREIQQQRPVKIRPRQVFVKNAGLVILNSYLPLLFDRLGLVSGKGFINLKAQLDAVHHLQYLATGLCRTEELLLPLNKLLSGLSLSQPVMDELDIPAEQKGMMDGLIKAAIGYWPAIGNCSVEGFRGNWLVRDGLLAELEDRWELTVEKRAYDILIQRSPFSFSIIKYPWMPKQLKVIWPY